MEDCELCFWLCSVTITAIQIFSTDAVPDLGAKICCWLEIRANVFPVQGKGHFHPWNKKYFISEKYMHCIVLCNSIQCCTHSHTWIHRHTLGGAGIAQWLERRTRDWKVAGSNPCRSGGRISFSRVDYLCWLVFGYPFNPRVTAVARKKSRSFCQKCRWQVTVKHAYTLRMWLCMKWHGAWLYGVHRTCAETAAVSCGTSHASAVSTPLRWIFKNAL